MPPAGPPRRSASQSNARPDAVTMAVVRVLSVCALLALSCADEPLSRQVLTLQQQQAQDTQLLHGALRQAANTNTEFAALREEIITLK